MSARVFNPLVMSEMRRMIGRSRSDPGNPAVARVRRDLFGPVNHEDAQTFVEKELANMHSRESERWGFDFVNETPLQNERFQWERVPTPEAYAFRRISEVVRQSEKKEESSPNQTTTARPTTKQSQITDFLKCQRKRSLSAGDISLRKVGSGAAASVGSPASAPTALSEPKRRKLRQ